ncbi:ATP-binding cassette domain-containing protein [Dinghuibacter silviterrae]|uniref:ABC-2 type transport system ATP-binding protein n=1 Tax=Dinghuibacter silviterrae TaxID=1539049 RepID=A0A4R8DUM7_9BACT|nr:ATP-binding cassette domain-containing protein [Dinghuibacter silviterrae]TDX01628.1 ABC-2 type transport system ATP-binding protein [Dinghuibacter silviterrae]
MDTLLRTKGLRKTFASRTGPVEAVRGVDLDVKAGEIFGFLGPNGAGKTTTLRMLATLLVPDQGEAVVAGCDLIKAPGEVRKRIGYVSQTGGSDRDMTAAEDLLLQGRLYKVTDPQKRAKELIAALGLTDIARRKASTYSGGQKRRLDIALGMMHRPALLFLDEPTTGLDPASRAQLWDEIRRLRDEGTTVFLTTHYMDEADELSDRIAIMDKGTIVAEGTPRALKQQIAGDMVLLGLSGEETTGERALALLRDRDYVREAGYEQGAGCDQGRLRLYVRSGETVLPDILRQLDQARIGLASVSLSQPTLDDVFLKQTGRSLQEKGA